MGRSGRGTDLAVTDGLVKLVLDERQAARERKDFAAADHIRDSLTELGIRLEDGANGTRWTIA